MKEDFPQARFDGASEKIGLPFFVFPLVNHAKFLYSASNVLATETVRRVSMDWCRCAIDG